MVLDTILANIAHCGLSVEVGTRCEILFCGDVLMHADIHCI